MASLPEIPDRPYDGVDHHDSSLIRMAAAGATKIDALRALRDAFGYRRYLEFTTTITGMRYGDAQALGWERCERLVYRYDGKMYDELPIDYSSPDDDISTSVAALAARREPFDAILLDAHHTYYAARRDLVAACRLLRPGGTILMHDCWPRGAASVSPTFVPGAWSGVSYKVYLDFVLANPFVDYVTLDADYGCGVILKSTSPKRRIKNFGRAARQLRLAQNWHAIGSDYDGAYDFLSAHNRELLRLVDFQQLESKLAAGM